MTTWRASILLRECDGQRTATKHLTNVKKLYIIVTVLNKTKQMTTVTESGGRQNMYPTEPRPYLDESYKGYGLNAEQINGRLAMIGLVTGFISYAYTGNFFFFGLLGF